MPHLRFPMRHGRSFAALLALPLLLAGTAYAVDDASSGSASKAAAADPCARGNVLGAARVLGSGNIPNYYSGNPNHIFNRHNCSGQEGDHNLVMVQRLASGRYHVRFKNNPAQVAVVTAEHSQIKASVTPIGDPNDADKEFQIETRDVAAKGGEGKFIDSTVHILIG
jgi:hypothetical protein